MRPFLLSPVLVERPWGGSRLQEYGKDLPPEATIGESWEVADLPAGVASGGAPARTRVASGPHRGASLAELIRRPGDDLMGSVAPTPDGDFPLLVKLLDARENLSVQVHPHAEYAKTHPEVRLKTESWYVVEAAPGAEIFLDLVDGTTPEDLAAALGTSAIVDLLRRVPATPGDFHHLPAGLVHSLGAGVLVAEVQTPSDTTFRVYDWADEYGRAPRPLHHQEAQETIAIGAPGAMSLPAFGDEPMTRRLIETPYYWIVEHRADGHLSLDTDPGARVCLVVRGAADFDGLSASLGSTVVIPASSPGLDVRCDVGSVFLEVGFPPG